MQTENTGPEPEEIFNWLNGAFVKKYGGDKFSDDTIVTVNQNIIKLVLPEPGAGSFFSRPFSASQSNEGRSPSLKILCFRTGKDFMQTALQILPGMFSGNRRDIPYLSKRGIAVSAGRESNTLSFLNIRERKAIFLYEDISVIPGYESGSPFKTILQWWFDSPTCAMIHSASVCDGGNAVLISGRGGSGKTSTALACMFSGMGYIGDDYVIVSGDTDFSVSGVYNSAKLTLDSLGRFPDLRQKVTNPGFSEKEKGVAFLNEYCTEKMSEARPLKALVFPQISGMEKSSFTRITSSEGFRSIGPSTVFQHIGRRENITAFASRLTKYLPCFKLVAGTAPGDISSTVKKIMEEI